MTDAELMDILEGKTSIPQANSPQDAINSVAAKHGVNPEYLQALAKLETQTGSRSVGGTNNLFNIKGSGVPAYDKVEKSNDQYKKYGSYESSAEDLVSLLKRKYPGAMTAKTPQEFADSLKGYATDPQHASKLVNIIGKTSGGISDADLMAMLDASGSQPAMPVSQKEPASAFDVAKSSALSTLTAGFIPESTTEADRSASPIASAAGSMIGYMPYAMIPGGIPTHATVGGIHGAVTAYNEGATPGGILSGAALGAAFGGAGEAVGKGASGLYKAGRGVAGRASEALFPTKTAGAINKAAEKTLGKDAYDLYKVDKNILSGNKEFQKEAIKQFKVSPETLPSMDTKGVSRAAVVSDTVKEAVANTMNQTAGSALAGAGIGYVGGQIAGVDPLTSAIAGGTLGLFKVNLLKSTVKNATGYSKSFNNFLTKIKPESLGNEMDFMNTAAVAARRDAINANKTPVMAKEAGTKAAEEAQIAYREYQKNLKEFMNSPYNAGQSNPKDFLTKEYYKKLPSVGNSTRILSGAAAVPVSEDTNKRLFSLSGIPKQ